MGNGVLCKYCGMQDTDHEENPQGLPVVKKGEVTETNHGSVVCDIYTPNIKDEELVCTCTNDRKWCTGYCNFKSTNLIDEYQD